MNDSIDHPAQGSWGIRRNPGLRKNRRVHRARTETLEQVLARLPDEPLQMQQSVEPQFDAHHLPVAHQYSS